MTAVTRATEAHETTAGGTPPYVELHCHSAYSFLDGASLPDELARRAIELGHTALALTDHNSVSGSMELAQVVEHADLHAIHGVEIDMAMGEGAPRRHLTLLVRDARGWGNLCRIITHAHSHTREGSNRARTEPSVGLETVLSHSEGLVCLTGCARHGVHDEPTARALLEAFGREGLRVELQRPYGRHDRARNRALAALAGRLGVAPVATGNVHAHARARAELQDAFVALRHHATLDACEPLRRGNHTHVMSTPSAMAARFADHPEAVRETVRLAESLTFDLTENLGYRYPGAEDQSASRRLRELCRTRLQERYPTAANGGVPTHGLRAQAETHLERELQVIDNLGLAGFFLLHHEMLELAHEVAAEVRDRDSARALLAPGRGRGSSVSSIVCYLTGLSHIDPVANHLLLGRFLHDDLRGLPDIDLDFPRDIREVLIPRVHERFGDDRAALVAAFPTFRARGAIRELGKALGLPAGEIDRAARTADGWGGDIGRELASTLGIEPDDGDGPSGEPASTLGNGLDHGDGPCKDARDRATSSRWRWLVRLVEQAQRLPRHLSQHPGGMVLATRPLIDCCPMVPSAMEGRRMVQWDKDSCADAGFLKIDLLGLGMLSAVERCVDEIHRTRGERIDLSRIPFDDRRTFEAIQQADTVGVFQIESRAQMQSLKRTRPRNLRDLTVQVAIVRPGPIQGGAVSPYIERRMRLLEDPSFEPEYEHPALREVLKDTLGTIIFQDQVMQVAEAFAGFTPGQADHLRRAMSRKRSREAMDENREHFVTGAMRHRKADSKTAERVWEMVAGFAGFGFPKAHATAFGLLAYQSTWLRVHYGPEFLCALLNEQSMGFYAPDSLVHEAQRRGIEVLGLDVNASAVQCTVEGGGVRLGLGCIKGTVASEMQALVAERARGGPFRDLAALAARSPMCRSTLEQLAWSGACDRLANGRREALWQLGVAAGAQTTPQGTQLALPIASPRIPALRPLDRWQQLLADYATSGVTSKDHAMAVLRRRLRVPMLTTSAQLRRLPHGCSVVVAGLVIARQRPGTAKGTMFLLFEDEWGVANLIVPRAVYERRRALARAEPLLLARGRLERSSAGVLNVLVGELAALERFLAPDGIEREARLRGLPTREGEPSSEDDDGGDVESREDPREGEGTRMAAAMRAVAPPVQSFASGRRR